MATLINKSAARECALRYAQEHRPTWAPTRVAESFLRDLDERLRDFIEGHIETCPSKGKTIK